MFLRRFQEIKTDVPALIDEWASRFFEVSGQASLG